MPDPSQAQVPTAQLPAAQAVLENVSADTASSAEAPSTVASQETLEQLKQRIKALEDSSSSSVESFLVKVSSYGMRHDLDFDKYEALRLAEQLAAIPRSSSHANASFYDLAASSLRERLSVQNGHFKAHFLALLAEKDYSTVLESLAKVEKSLSRRDNAATRLR